MQLKSVFLTCATIAGAIAIAGAANASNTVNVQYFEIPTGSGSLDFDACCSSASPTTPSNPATLPIIMSGSGLVGGLPVVTAASNVADQSGSHQILWWTPGGTPTVTSEGSAIIPLPTAGINMFAPHNSGSSDATYFETAIVTGTITGNGSTPTTLTVSSDDDALVYLNGSYIGGNPGVHGVETTNFNLGNLNGSDSLEIFYADRAQDGAVLGIDVTGATISGAPEPASWALMLLGVGGIGAAMRMSRRKSDAALATA